jgi:hypothetical protein
MDPETEVSVLSWGGYSNGQIPLSVMVNVRGEYFHPAAGSDIICMGEAFLTEFGKDMTITSGYRALGSPSDPPNSDSQWGAWNYYQQGGPLAAYPGTSNHGWGQAADLGSGINVFGSAEHNWAVAVGPTYGWTWGAAPSEAWHFEHLSLSQSAPGCSSQEDDMVVRELIATPDGTVWFCVDRIWRYPIPDSTTLATYQAHLRDLGQSDTIVSKSTTAVKAYGQDTRPAPVTVTVPPISDADVDRIAVATQEVLQPDFDEVLAAIAGDETPDPCDTTATLGRIEATVNSVDRRLGSIAHNLPTVALVVVALVLVMAPLLS